MKKFISLKLVGISLLVLIHVMMTAGETQAQVYSNQYAVIIGINQYQSSQWQALSYARNDAEGIAALMQQLGFKVYSLYDRQATKANILSLLEDRVARRVRKNDALFFFFAGHGATEHLGGKTWGYIVPSDASAKPSSYISMDELVILSEKMGNAKHQLFVMDYCFGGLLGKKRAGGISEQHPYYLREISTRIARQILTAGGENQQVADGGPYGHSSFTGYLIKGI
ncbi:MAG: caspase family protein, partial [bacterium]